MAKMDKEALQKNKFWIGLGAFVLLWLVGLLTLQMSAGSMAEAKKKEYEKSKTDIEGWTGKAKNKANYVPPWDEYGKTFRDHKNTIWQEAWAAQKHVLKWPTGGDYAANWNKTASFDDWKKKMEDQTGGYSTTVCNEYRGEYYVQLNKEVYKPTALFPQRTEEEQKLEPLYVYQLEKQMAPIEFKGGRAGFETIMAPATSAVAGGAAGGPGGVGPGAIGPPGGRGGPVMPGPGGPGGPGGAAPGNSITSLWAKDPTVEEIWLAQEDYSVKYELLQVARRTVDSVAKLTRDDEITKDKPLPEKAIKALGFRNSRWQIVLYLEREGNKDYISKKSTIKNLSPRVLLLSNPRTRGPLVFELRQGNARYPLRLKGEPLGSQAQVEIGEQFSVATVSLDGPVEMAQVFDWSTSPVRRIDDLRLGYNSHRTSNLPLIASKHFPEPEVPVDPAAGGPGETTPGGPASSSTPPLGGRGEGPGGAAGAGPVATTAVNGLVKNRYIHVTGQARSMPVGVTVVVDQTHIHDFLAELANCHLRFQITQVQIRHVRDVASIMETAATPGTGTGPGTGPGDPGDESPGGRPGGIGGRQPGPGTPGPGMPGPGMPGPGTPGGLVASNPLDPNLVELTVYGIATLYEKFHLPKDETADPNAAKPTTP